MLGSKLIEVIEASSKNSSSAELEKIRQWVRKPSKDINDLSNGYTACHAAVKAGNFPVLELLVLEGQADLSIQDEAGKVPKDYAEDIEFSIKIAALNAEQMRRKQSAGMHLHDIIPTGKKRAIKARIASHPQEINEITYCKRNAGHIAALYYPKCIKWLVKAGLDLTAQDSTGDTCFDIVSLDKDSKQILVERYRQLFINSMNEDEQVGSLSLLLQDMQVGSTFKKTRLQSLQSRTLTRAKSFRILERPEEATEKTIDIENIDDIIQADSITRLRAYINNHSLSHQDFILRACDEKKPRILVWLLQHRCTLDMLTPFGTAIDKEQAAFWFKVIERIDAINCQREDKTYQQELSKHEVHFQRLLIQNGLMSNLLPYDALAMEHLNIERLSEKNDCDLQLLKTIYQIISRHFDAASLRQTALGMLSLHSAKEIFKTIIALTPCLSLAQKRHALFFAKELFCQDKVRRSYLSKRFCMTTLVELFDALQLSQRDEFYDALLNIVNTLRKLHNPLIEASLLIQARLAESGYHYREESSDVQMSGALPKNYEPCDLAMACKAISISFYQRVHSTEFGDKQWQREKKRDTSPTIVQSQQLFDALSQYVQTEIFKRKKLSQRVEFIGRIVSTLEILLADDMPDLNSAMALISALNSHAVQRLTETFKALDEQTSKRLALINKKLDGVDNYRSHREIMRNNPRCLPFLGVYLRDMEFSGHNSSVDSSVLMGRTYQDLDKRKSVFSNVRPASLLGLLPILQSWEPLSENEIAYLSHQIQGGFIYLDDETTLECMSKYLQIYAKTGFLMRIYYENTTTVGEEVIATLFTWLRDVLLKKPLTKEHQVNQVIELISQLSQNDPQQTAFKEQKLAFDIWHTTVHSMTLLPQFSRLSITLPEAERVEPSVEVQPNNRQSY